MSMENVCLTEYLGKKVRFAYHLRLSLDDVRKTSGSFSDSRFAFPVVEVLIVEYY